ncbi:MAG: DUF5723 family protein [Bacteroidota bacterium]
MKQIRFILPALLLSVTIGVLGQSNGTLYHLQGVVPQSHLMNPAFQPMCGFYLGLPGISPLNVRAEWPFSLSDVIMHGPNDSLITFMYSAATQNEFKKSIHKNNRFYMETAIPIASIGLRVQKSYFTLDYRQRFNTSLSLPGDFLEFLLEWNEDGDVFDFKHFGVNTRLYQEFGLGVSHEVSKNLTVGGKAKLLFGIADLSTVNNNLKINTSLENWEITSDFALNASLPYVEVYRNDEGKFDDFDFDADSTLEILKTDRSALFKNVGLAADFGAVYTPISRLTLSASLIDLGFIKWTQSTYNISQNSTFLFDGIVLDSLQSDNFFDQVLDSIADEFQLSNTEDSYNTMLYGKVYLGARYNVTEQFSVGVLSRSQFLHGRINEKLTLSANLYPGKALSLAFSYSIQNYSYNNLGIGLSSKLGPFNWYMVLDNVPFMAETPDGLPIIPHTMKSLNFMTGFNLVFGCNKLKKLMKDKPMLQ